jgi:hypothetical protein
MRTLRLYHGTSLIFSTQLGTRTYLPFVKH